MREPTPQGVVWLIYMEFTANTHTIHNLKKNGIMLLRLSLKTVHEPSDIAQDLSWPYWILINLFVHFKDVRSKRRSYT